MRKHQTRRRPVSFEYIVLDNFLFDAWLSAILLGSSKSETSYLREVVEHQLLVHADSMVFYSSVEVAVCQDDEFSWHNSALVNELEERVLLIRANIAKDNASCQVQWRAFGVVVDNFAVWFHFKLGNVH